MDAACRGGGAIAGIFKRVEPTGRRGAGRGFGVQTDLLRRYGHAEGIPLVCLTLSEEQGLARLRLDTVR